MEVFVKRQIFYALRVFLEKTLPKRGEILVRTGEAVKPFTVLGHTYLSLFKKRWPLRKGSLVVVGDGAAVAAGEVLAKKSSLMQQELIKSSLSGTARVYEEEGFIEVSSSPERFNLISGIEAKVVKILPRLSVLLQTQATVLQGVWASGPEVVGELSFLDLEENIARTKDLTPEDTGKIVVFPNFVTLGVLQKAKALGLAGLVCAGVEKNSVGEMLPVLTTEGFGPGRMPEKTIRSLKNMGLKTAVISPPRRQLIVPGYQEEDSPLVVSRSEKRELKIGDRVQVLSWPYFPEEGIVNSVFEEIEFESGIKAPGVVVKRIKNSEEVKIPINNILILQ